MNPVVRAQLTEFKQKHVETTMSDSEMFEVLSIYSIENGILGENIDPFKIHLTGSEFGVDGIGILIQGSLCTDVDDVDVIFSQGKNHACEFHFFQTKTSEGLDYGDVSKFLDGVYDFFTNRHLLQSPQVDDLSVVKDKIYANSSKLNPVVKCFYTTTGSGEVPGLIQKLVETHKKRLESLNIFSEIFVKFIGAVDIQQGYRSASNSSSATIDFSKNVTLPTHPQVEEGYIGFVSASQIIAIASSQADPDGTRIIRRSVFFDNVRDFNPNSSINKSIINELKQGEKESFVFRNNGITVVAKGISRKGDSFTIEDFQIVNGCQTTNILFYSGVTLDDVYVPFRLIGSQDPDFVASIIVGTNKQNEVRDEQFWALLPFMKDLEEFSRAKSDESRIFIERRENQYRDIQIERTRIVKPADLMKSVAAMFLFQPNRAARDYRGIRDEFEGKIFQKDHNVELYHLAALASYWFDYFVRNKKIDRAKAIYKFYALYFLIRKFSNSKTILSSSKKTQAGICKAATDIVTDNDKFLEHILHATQVLDGLIAAAGITTREQIRDYIRSESVVSAFDSIALPAPAP